ncbi:MAG: restriction endonuclease subunit S [Lachnospiraceae bacterium]|nr:restriction endonuclease subunit S [Lachnospiraceae bacterium]
MSTTMSKTINNRLYKEMNVISGIIEMDQMISTFLLINEVKKAIEDGNVAETPEELYALLLVVADKKGMQNPFSDSEQFYRVFSNTTGQIPWEQALILDFQSCRYPILPEVLIKKIVDRISKKTNTVLIAEAEKFVPFLQWIIDENINTEFTLTSQVARYVGAMEKVFEEYENVRVVQASIYEYEFVNQRFDVILSFPIFGGRTLVEDQAFMCREYDMVALENLAYHLKNGGEMVIILPGRITFATGKIADLRNFVQNNYTIKELAELPEGILEYTGIKAYLLDIENTRPGDDDVIVRRYSAGRRKSKKAAVTELNIQDDTFVMLSELEQQGDWSIDRIFAQQDEEYLSYQNLSIHKDLLGNVAQVFRGKSVSEKAENGPIGVVNISNIGEYEIHYENLNTINEDERKVANYILQEGDVLLPCRGTAIRTSIFHKQSFPIIAHSNVIVIRPDDKKLNSVYLKVFLDSPFGNKLISSTQQGVTVMNIRYKDLAAIEIPVPSMSEQRKVAGEYTKELQIYMDITAEAEKRWQGILGRLQSF